MNISVCRVSQSRVSSWAADARRWHPDESWHFLNHFIVFELSRDSVNFGPLSKQRAHTHRDTHNTHNTHRLLKEHSAALKSRFII